MQSIHLTLKNPPNPEPTRSLGIFEKNEHTATIINTFLAGISLPPSNDEFKQNLKDEVLKSLSTGEVVAVLRDKGMLQVFLTDVPRT